MNEILSSEKMIKGKSDDLKKLINSIKASEK